VSAPDRRACGRVASERNVMPRTRALCCTALLAFSAAGACSAPARLADAATSERAFATRVPAAPIANYARITPTLGRGAQPDAEGLRYLAEQGCRTIVNLRAHHSQRAEVEALGLRYVEIPLHAGLLGSTAPTDAEVRRFFEVVLDPLAQPVFFHCAHGKDRTGTMASLYRIEVDGWDCDDAIEEMLAFGYHTIYRDLIAFVRAYEARGLAASTGGVPEHERDAPAEDQPARVTTESR
jgi:tyrosine-protein phosphatase SIW14